MWPDWMFACREMNVVPVYLRELHWYVLQCERFFRIHAGRGSDVQVTVIFSISLTCLVRYWFKCPLRLSSFPVILVVSEWILTLECMWFLCAVFYFILFWYIYIIIYITHMRVCTHWKVVLVAWWCPFFFFSEVEFSGGWKASRVLLLAHCFAFLFFCSFTYCRPCFLFRKRH